MPGGNVLPAGTVLHEYEIRGVIAEGGFGIVYDAWDAALGRPVALKEYMPSMLATRLAQNTVAAKSERYAETFAIGMRSFINEARLLARFDHASLVKVYRFFEAHGTAYMVMPRYDGITLRDALKSERVRPTEAWIKRMLIGIINALRVVHAESCYHRDIAPDNILILKDERPVLLDFGAARRVIGDMTQDLTVILKPGYAPLEQYAEIASLTQGPWTDVYALAAVVHYMITGAAPPPSVTRSVKDSLEPLAKVAAGRYSPRFLRAIDKALALYPKDRPQSMDDFASTLALDAVPDSEETVILAKPHIASMPSRRPLALRNPFMIGALVAIPLIALAGWLALRAPPAVAPQEPVKPAPAAAAPETPPAPSPAPPAPPARTPFDALAAFAEVQAGADTSHVVSVTIPRPIARIKKDLMTFTLSSSRPGFVYLMLHDTSAHLSMVFPNALDSNNRIDAGKPAALPRKHWEMLASGPAGRNEFLVIVSEHPRTFAGFARGPSGLQELSIHRAEQLHREHVAALPFLAGAVACPAAQPQCPANYGAARFAIEEIEATR